MKQCYPHLFDSKFMIIVPGKDTWQGQSPKGNMVFLVAYLESTIDLVLCLYVGITFSHQIFHDVFVSIVSLIHTL